MTDILTQVDCERGIIRDLGLLEEATDLYKDLLEAEARAEVKYKKRKASMFLRASGPVRDKEAFSDQECSDEFEAYRLAEARSKACRENMRMLHARLENLRSLNANVRSQV